MTIIIGDANDESPVCPVLSEISLERSTDVGSTIFQLTVTDADIGVNAQIRFNSVQNGDSTESSLFEVDTNTGEIRTIA